MNGFMGRTKYLPLWLMVVCLHACYMHNRPAPPLCASLLFPRTCVFTITGAAVSNGEKQRFEAVVWRKKENIRVEFLNTLGVTELLVIQRGPQVFVEKVRDKEHMLYNVAEEDTRILGIPAQAFHPSFLLCGTYPGADYAYTVEDIRRGVKRPLLHIHAFSYEQLMYEVTMEVLGKAWRFRAQGAQRVGECLFFLERRVTVDGVRIDYRIDQYEMNIPIAEERFQWTCR